MFIVGEMVICEFYKSIYIGKIIEIKPLELACYVIQIYNHVSDIKKHPIGHIMKFFKKEVKKLNDLNMMEYL